MIRIILTTMLGVFTLQIAAQTADSLQLDTVNVTAAHVDPMIGTRTDKLDSIILQVHNSSTLSELLINTGTMAIRTYGISGSANVSIRGSGPSHTMVLWNGIPLNDIMLGQSDVSTIPVSVADDVEILKGPASMVYKPGGIGGAISMSSAFRKKDGLSAKLNLGYGSFSNYNALASVSNRKGIWASNTSVNYSYGLNDFEYRNLATIDNRTETTENAELKNMSIQHGSQFQINLKNRLEVAFLGLRTERQLPRTILEPPSDSHMSDDDLAGTLIWKRTGQISSLSVQGMYMYSHQAYSLSDSTHEFDHFYNVARLSVRHSVSFLRKLKLLTGMDGNYQTARSDSAYGHKLRNRNGQALFSSLQYHPHKRLGLQLFFREDLIDGQFSPIQWCVGTQWDIIDRISIIANFSRNHRVPSLNDLYWQPGGNPDLIPESGLSYETGLRYSGSSSNSMVSCGVTWFDSWINDMIVWRPGIGSIWSPLNQKKVHSRGIEADLKMNTGFRSWLFSAVINYNWVRATIESSDRWSAGTEGKLLTNIPQHELGAHISIKWKSTSFTYGHTFVGERPTTADNSSWLQPYALAWLAVGQTIPIKRHALGLSFKLHNIFNTQYQLIEWRPMPGINYSFTISYRFT